MKNSSKEQVRPQKSPISAKEIKMTFGGGLGAQKLNQQAVHSYESRPEQLLKGMSEYMHLQAISTKIDTLNYSPPSKKKGWRLLQKGLLNQQAPQHAIFQENLKLINPENQTERYKLKFKKLPTDEPVIVVTKRFMNFEKLIKRNENNRKVVGVITRAKERIGELSELKSNLQTFKDSHWVDQMKKQFQTHNENAPIQVNQLEDLSSDDELIVGDTIGGVPIQGFHSSTFDHHKQPQIMPSSSIASPEIISHRLYHAQTLASQAKTSHEHLSLKAKILKHNKVKKLSSSSNPSEYCLNQNYQMLKEKQQQIKRGLIDRQTNARKQKSADFVGIMVVQKNQESRKITQINDRALKRKRDSTSNQGGFVINSIDSKSRDNFMHRRKKSDDGIIYIKKDESRVFDMNKQLQLRSQMMKYIISDDEDQENIQRFTKISVKPPQNNSYATALAKYAQHTSTFDGFKTVESRELGGLEFVNYR